MKLALCSASRAAILIALAGSALPAWSQDTLQTDDGDAVAPRGTTSDIIVVKIGRAHV